MLVKKAIAGSTCPRTFTHLRAHEKKDQTLAIVRLKEAVQGYGSYR